MVKWIIFISILISGGVLWYLYTNISELDTTPSATPNPIIDSTRVFHAFQDNIHRFSGQIKLPHSCYSVDTRTIVEGSLVTISILTTDNITKNRVCAMYATRYSFDVLAEAPEGSEYEMTIDDKKQEIRIVNTKWTSSAGTIINPL